MLKRIGCVLYTGCPESGIDSAKVQNLLIANNWNITNDFKKADLILLRTCGITKQAEEYTLQGIRKIKAEKKDSAQLIVWGCLPKIASKSLKTEYIGDTFGEDQISLLNTILDVKKPIEEISANYIMKPFKHKESISNDYLTNLVSLVERKFSVVQNKPIFHIKASSGCLGTCSFCAIRKSRGTVQSKSIDVIISEFRKGLDQGFKYFSLLGTDLGAYGRDLGNNLVDLLVELVKIEGDYKIALRNVNPYYLLEMFEGLKPIFSSGKIWFLLSAVESGSDRILKLMNRKYKLQDFKKIIQIINTEYPSIFLRTQLLVGFPTETDQDFQKTINLLDELKFNWVEVYTFDCRPGTPAAEMEGQVKEKIKKQRFRKLTLKAISQQPLKKIRQILSSY